MAMRETKGAPMRGPKKPKWVVEKEQAKRIAANATVWLFGLHAVRDALVNPKRKIHKLIVTQNAMNRLGDVVQQAGVEPEIVDPRKFTAPIDKSSVHQGAALEVGPLDWGNVQEMCATAQGEPSLVVVLDRVSDPHNVGAILRSAEVFGAKAVIAPARHAAPETGALAKTASGALERQPYLRVKNLGDSIELLKSMGYFVIGFAGEAEETLGSVLGNLPKGPVALVLGAEGPGLRERTRGLCDSLARIEFSGEFGSLNVSNAAAVGLYATRNAMTGN